jgi:hypothetical protein
VESVIEMAHQVAHWLEILRDIRNLQCQGVDFPALNTLADIARHQLTLLAARLQRGIEFQRRGSLNKSYD